MAIDSLPVLLTESAVRYFEFERLDAADHLAAEQSSLSLLDESKSAPSDGEMSIRSQHLNP